MIEEAIMKHGEQLRVRITALLWFFLFIQLNIFFSVAWRETNELCDFIYSFQNKIIKSITNSELRAANESSEQTTSIKWYIHLWNTFHPDTSGKRDQNEDDSILQEYKQTWCSYILEINIFLMFAWNKTSRDTQITFPLCIYMKYYSNIEP